MHLSDYQNRPNGGDGWLRLLTFDPAADRIAVQTYSPTLDTFETDANSSFVESFDMDVAPTGWQTIGTTTVTGGGGVATATWTGLAEATEYEWYVRVGHDTFVTDNSAMPWSFRTVSPTTSSTTSTSTTSTVAPTTSTTVPPAPGVLAVDGFGRS